MTLSFEPYTRGRRTPAIPLTAAALSAACALILAAPTVAQDRDADRLEEIVVTASVIETPRRQIGTAVSLIQAEEMELRGYHSMADILRTQPGIAVTNAGGHGKTTGLRIRGEDAWRTLLMIDGVKAIDPSAVQAAPIFDSLLTTTADLERVEVLRGPQGFMYGADAGGVVNVITRRGAGDVNGRVGLEYGRYDARRLDASIAGGNETGDYFLSVTDFETAGFNAQTADTELPDDDGAENRTWHTKLGWNPTDALRLELVARDIDAYTEFDGCFSSTTFETSHDCVATTAQTTYRVAANHDSGALRNNFAYSHVDVKRDSFSEGVLTFGAEGEIGRLEYLGSAGLTPDHTLAYGLDFQRERMLSDERQSRWQRGYYVEYQGAFQDHFYLSAGARYDDNEDFGSHTSARLSGAYVQDIGADNTLKYRTSVGTGFRAPSLFEVAYNRGAFAMPPASDVTLREESSRGYDVGVEYDTAGGLHLGLTYFNQRITDEIFFDLVAFSGYLQSEGTSRSRGVELAAQLPIGRHWEFFGNWTYNETADTDNEQRLRRPRNFGNVGVLYAAPGDRLRLVANYRLSRDSIDIGQVALDDYAVLDLSAVYAVGDRIEVYGRVENATDETYQELIGFNTPGRTAHAGMRFRF